MAAPSKSVDGSSKSTARKQPAPNKDYDPEELLQSFITRKPIAKVQKRTVLVQVALSSPKPAEADPAKTKTVAAVKPKTALAKRKLPQPRSKESSQNYSRNTSALPSQ